MEFCFVPGPDLAHGEDLFAHDGPTLLVGGAVVFHLLAVPASADAEHDTTVGNHVQRRDLLGQRDGVAFDDQTDAGAEADA